MVGNLESTLISILTRARGANAEDDVPLADREGMARTVLDLGIGRLQEAGRDPAEIMAGYGAGERLCESPIERIVLAGLMTNRWKFGAAAVHDASTEQMLVPRSAGMTIVPQARFMRYRLDFALVSEWGGAQHVVAVECDGAAFHQGIADHERDLYLASWGIPCFHLSGAAIVRDVHQALEPVGECLWQWRQTCVTDLREAAVEIGRKRLGWL